MVTEGVHKLSDEAASFLRSSRGGNLKRVLEFLANGFDINTCNANGLNALHLASKEGHVDIVNELLIRGAKIDCATRKGNTALHIASLAGQIEVIRALLQHQASVNVQSQNGFTPLYMAAQENHETVVKLLLGGGANSSLATEDGFNPLAVALQQGHDKIVALLLEHDSRSKVKLPALHIAAKKDDVRSANLLLENGHDPDVTSKSGFTPLHIASHYGNESIARLLIEHNANVNFPAKHNITPLHVAAKWGKLNMVALLIANTGKLESKTRDGLTPLHCAARSGHESVVDFMIQRGAPISAKTKNGLAPIHMSSQGDHVDAARILILHRAPVDEVTVDYLTSLHVAAHCGHVRIAKILLDNSADPNARALNGFTPLHIACKKNRIKVVELLLKYGASVEATTESGLTPLHVASFIGCLNIVIFLIQNMASPNESTVRGETPLHLAARANQTEVIKILLKHDAKVDARAREQQTALHIASRLGNIDIVVLLLESGAKVDSTTKDLYTSLHIVAKEGHEEVAAILLSYGASLNCNTKKGFSPLHLASKYGNLNISRLFINHVISEASENLPESKTLSSLVNGQGKNGVTPLHVASHYSHPDITQLLLKYGADCSSAAHNGYTPLHISAKKNEVTIAKQLLAAGANVNSESKAGFTPLHLASQEGHVEMTHLLIDDNGADVNAKAKNGLTPLHLSAQENRIQLAEILERRGADLNAETNAGYTPLHVAAHFGSVDVVTMLIGHDPHTADPQPVRIDVQNDIGYTPLHQAAQQGHSVIVKMLLEAHAQPNAVSESGETALGIAERLGLMSVVETLRVVSEEHVRRTTTKTTTVEVVEEKYKFTIPESMQETFLSDSEEDEAGDEHTVTAQSTYKYLTADEMKSLGDETAPIEDVVQDEKMQNKNQVAVNGELDNRRRDIPNGKHNLNNNNASEVYSETDPDQENKSLNSNVSIENRSRENIMFDSTTINGTLEKKILALESGGCGGNDSQPDFKSAVNERIFEVDNIQLSSPKPHPIHAGKLNWRGFLVSFMVDARGGAMRGCRHSGIRVIVPPRKAAMPMRITCKYLRKDKLIHPPPLMEGEALASRILELGPYGAKFLGPVIIEVPHFASLRGKEREIVILRSDDGETWKEHSLEATQDAVQDVLQESFDADEMNQIDDLNTNRITRILTTDFPHYFAIVSRLRQEIHSIGPDGGVINSTVLNNVQAYFPPGALTKKIKVGIQTHPMSSETTAKLLGNRLAISPIVTVEPRRRKFHKAITLTIPLPESSSSSNKSSNNASSDIGGGGFTPGSHAPNTLRLLCSITGGTTRAQWEDVTGSTPLTISQCKSDPPSSTSSLSVSFTTTVSARFWLVNVVRSGVGSSGGSLDMAEVARYATQLYRESIHVPLMAKFVVFSKRHEVNEARLRIFCMTDDKEDKTLEFQEHFTEIAKSRDIEVLEGKNSYIELTGNLAPIMKSREEELHIRFHAFRENRVPFNVKVRNDEGEATARINFMKDSISRRASGPVQLPLCSLNIRLPEDITPDTQDLSLLTLDSGEVSTNTTFGGGGGGLEASGGMLGGATGLGVGETASLNSSSRAATADGGVSLDGLDDPPPLVVEEVEEGGHSTESKYPEEGEEDERAASSALREEVECQSVEMGTLNESVPMPSSIQMETDSSTDDQMKGQRGGVLTSQIIRTDLNVADIASSLSHDWPQLASALHIDPSDVEIIKNEFPNDAEQQATVMLRLWLNDDSKSVNSVAIGKELECALKQCNRHDIILQHVLASSSQPQNEEQITVESSSVNNSSHQHIVTDDFERMMASRHVIDTSSHVTTVTSTTTSHETVHVQKSGDDIELTGPGAKMHENQELLESSPIYEEEGITPDGDFPESLTVESSDDKSVEFGPNSTSTTTVVHKSSSHKSSKTNSSSSSSPSSSSSSSTESLDRQDVPSKDSNLQTQDSEEKELKRESEDLYTNSSALPSQDKMLELKQQAGECSVDSSDALDGSEIHEEVRRDSSHSHSNSPDIMKDEDDDDNIDGNIEPLIDAHIPVTDEVEGQRTCDSDEDKPCSDEQTANDFVVKEHVTNDTTSTPPPTPNHEDKSATRSNVEPEECTSDDPQNEVKEHMKDEETLCDQIQQRMVPDGSQELDDSESPHSAGQHPESTSDDDEVVVMKKESLIMLHALNIENEKEKVEGEERFKSSFCSSSNTSTSSSSLTHSKDSQDEVIEEMSACQEMSAGSETQSHSRIAAASSNSTDDNKMTLDDSSSSTPIVESVSMPEINVIKHDEVIDDVQEDVVVGNENDFDRKMSEILERIDAHVSSEALCVSHVDDDISSDDTDVANSTSMDKSEERAVSRTMSSSSSSDSSVTSSSPKSKNDESKEDDLILETKENEKKNNNVEINVTECPENIDFQSYDSNRSDDNIDIVAGDMKDAPSSPESSVNSSPTSDRADSRSPYMYTEKMEHIERSFEESAKIFNDQKCKSVTSTIDYSDALRVAKSVVDDVESQALHILNNSDVKVANSVSLTHKQTECENIITVAKMLVSDVEKEAMDILNSKDETNLSVTTDDQSSLLFETAKQIVTDVQQKAVSFVDLRQVTNVSNDDKLVSKSSSTTSVYLCGSTSHANPKNFLPFKFRSSFVSHFVKAFEDCSSSRNKSRVVKDGQRVSSVERSSKSCSGSRQQHHLSRHQSECQNSSSSQLESFVRQQSCHESSYSKTSVTSTTESNVFHTAHSSIKLTNNVHEGSNPLRDDISTTLSTTKTSQYVTAPCVIVKEESSIDVNRMTTPNLDTSVSSSNLGSFYSLSTVNTTQEEGEDERDKLSSTPMDIPDFLEEEDHEVVESVDNEVSGLRQRSGSESSLEEFERMERSFSVESDDSDDENDDTLISERDNDGIVLEGNDDVRRNDYDNFGIMNESLDSLDSHFLTANPPNVMITSLDSLEPNLVADGSTGVVNGNGCIRTSDDAVMQISCDSIDIGTSSSNNVLLLNSATPNISSSPLTT